MKRVNDAIYNSDEITFDWDEVLFVSRLNNGATRVFFKAGYVIDYMADYTEAVDDWFGEY